MRERLIETVKKYAVILAVGATYLLFVLLTGIGIPCVFNKLTGWLCPACGVSRMIISAVKLDFVAAFHYNPFLFVNAPVILFCLIYPDIAYVKHGCRSYRWINIILWAEIAMLLLFGVLRNF